MTADQGAQDMDSASQVLQDVSQQTVHLREFMLPKLETDRFEGGQHMLHDFDCNINGIEKVEGDGSSE